MEDAYLNLVKVIVDFARLSSRTLDGDSCRHLSGVIINGTDRGHIFLGMK